MNSLFHMFLEILSQLRVDFQQGVYRTSQHINGVLLVDCLDLDLDAVLQGMRSLVAGEEHVLLIAHKLDLEKVPQGLILVVNRKGARVCNLGVVLVINPC